MSNSGATAIVTISPRRTSSDARLRVDLKTRSSLPQVGEAKMTKAAQDAGIPVQGVSNCFMGNYFELILRPGSKLLSDADRMTTKVLAALPAIYGEKISFQLA